MLRTILIVDDSIVNRKLLRRMLQAEYDLLEAENGQQALDLLRKHGESVSAILLDLVMPVMDGYALLGVLNADAALSQIPVIVMTGSGDVDTEVRVLSMGANDFILKPYHPAVILRRLWNTINLRETSAYVNTIQRDKLTGLYNRETFFKKVEEMIGAHAPDYYVMACFNVNNFKVVNDQYGNAKGDEMLRMLADIFRRGFDPVGGVCCRVTADNFAVLYPRSFMDSPEIAAIRRDAARLDGSIPPISFSVGRYIISDLSLSPSAMFDRAVIALTSVKARFDVQVAQYDESMRENILREQEIINEMNDALAQGQFEPWLQPQYNHASGALIGTEALVRWRHPAKGLIPPNVFIPVFERNGFIYEMDKSIWTQICALLRRWMDEGLDPLPVSVNASRYDIFRPDFYDVMTGLVEKYRIPLDLFRLEITESAFAKSTEQIVSIVQRLVNYGFTVEIDDFGSGYSSFNTLKDVPANILKLDMRFLEGHDNASRSGSILESIVRMAKWLDMPVIAEGVETREQADYLRSIGCFYVQGYLYARPMPVAEFERIALSATKERRMAALEKIRSLDNNAFWDPRSMETLIFNSYVGGACIFEYANGRVELLRVNEKYALELGGADMTLEDALRFDIAEHLDDENKAIMLANIDRAIRTDEECACELCIEGITKEQPIIWQHSTVRVIARAGQRYLFYCAIANTTARHEAERKERESVEQLRFLSAVSHELAARADVNAGIQSALLRILQYFEADRAYIIELNNKERLFVNTYEACAAGVESQMASLQATPFEDVPFWSSAFEGDQYINIEDVSALDESRAEERRGLEAQGVRSLIAVPLRRDGRVIGFIGADDPKRSQRNVDRLFAVCDVIANALTRRDLITRIENDNKTLLGLMNDTPGGFTRMRALPDGGIVPVYVNDGFCKLVGRSAEYIIEKLTANIFWGIHPDDVIIIQTAIAEMRATGETRSTKYRLRRGDAGYAWMRIFGRMTRGAAGETFFNVYYTEVTEQEDKDLTFGETLQIALNAMMASSTDLSFVKDKNFAYLCCTGAFARMVGLESEHDVVGKTDFDLFDRALAECYRADDVRLMESRQPIVDQEEHLPSRDGTPRYSRTSKYLLYDSTGDVIGLYGTGRDITESREAYAQLKLLANVIPGGLAMYELTPKTWRLRYFSDGYFAATGYTRAEYQALADGDVSCLIFPQDMPALRAQVGAVFAGSDTLEYAYRARNKDGSYSWLMLRGMVLERAKDRVLINAVKCDITQQMQSDEKLRIREEEYRLAIAHSGKMVYRYSHTENRIDLPEDTAALLGLPTRIDNVSVDLLRNVAPESRTDYHAFYDAIRRGDKTGIMTIQRRLTDGLYHWFTVRFSNIFDDMGKPVSAIVVLEDVTDARAEQIVEALDRSRLMAAMQTIYPVAVSVNLTKKSYQIIADGTGSMSAIAQSGAYDDLISAAQRFVEPEYAERFARSFDTEHLLSRLEKAGDSQRIEFRQAGQDGRVHWVEATAIRVGNDFGEDVAGVLVFRLVDDLKTTEDQLKQARIDGMTGLYNKTTTENLVRQSVARGGGGFCAMIVADLDTLKGINDTLGHDQGDNAIRIFSKLLRTQFRQTDVVGRVGGDEFVVFMEGGSVARVRSIMTAFMRSLSAVRLGEKRDVPLRGSVGITTGMLGNDTYESLFKRADRALYHVKRNGKDDFAFYTPEMERQSFQYKEQRAASRWQTADLGNEELERLVKAVTALYPLVISANLSQNSYYTLQSGERDDATIPSAGVFDELIAECALNLRREDRPAFMAAFSRASQFAAHADGRKVVSWTGRTLGGDDAYATIHADAVFVRSDDDLRQITLVRRLAAPDAPPRDTPNA